MIYTELDLLGDNPDNLITKTYPIRLDVPTNSGQVIVPEYGVFHTAGLVVKHVDTNTVLTRGTDYYLTYYSRHLKAAYDIDGYAGIVLVNKTLTGTISLETQQVGGGYTKFNSTMIKEVVTLINGVPENLDWDALVDAPAVANPNTHSLPAENIATGFKDYVSMLWQVGKALRSVAEKFDNTKIPIGTSITTVLPNPGINLNYWVTADGQTITREDYPAFFLTLDITNDTFVLPNQTNTYIRTN